MGKISAAKKKAKRKDFQKVKFKVGKKLPKNLNETKATFQAKTLIIKKQFQLEKEGPVSHRNLSWKELLAHLGHHNQSIKLDAINSLKEMIIGNPDFIRLELSYLLESLCPVFSDREYKVREAAMQLFKTIILLSGLNQKKHNVLEPFYNLINVHLTFSMTHIVESIQQSSLKFLDILIEHMPELIRVHSYDIFENFINQISKAAVKGDKRTLKNEPYKMTSTQTWRCSVLSRLYKMLKIVLSSDSKNKKFLDTEDIGDWIKTNGCQTLEATFDDIDRKCFITTYPNKTEQISLRISKRMNGKKSLTEVKEFFETYFKIVTPLLVECWLEAKPENKQIIESNESLDIMNSVLLILNLLLDNLEFNFCDLTIQLKSSKGSNQINYIENLFLADFPYMLAENFEYSAETRKTTQQINGNTINLLLCKFCSSSLLKLTEDKLFAIFEYCLNTLMKANAKNCNENVPLETNELQTLLKLSETIFKNFSRSEIVKPFAISLISYFESASNFSTNKWIVFEFLCKQFYENDKLMNTEYDNIFLSFYKKIFKYCISYEKEKKERIEQLIDWLRMIIIRRAKTQKILLNLLENEYINMINALDFESKEVTDSAKKKLLELLYWLPKINRYLFSKLSILILTKKISIINTNQILDILKTMLEDSASAPSRFDHSDYLMFMLCLFNGSSGFDLTNSLPHVNGESFIIDISKFRSHKVLCKHLEEYFGSHKNSDLLIEILLSTSLPVLTNLHTVPCSTLYGSLSLISKLEKFDGSPLLYNTIIEWLFKLLFWLINKIQSNQNNQVGTIDMIDDINQCLNEIQSKVEHILRKNSQLMNDLVSKICLTGFAMPNSLELKRKSFILVNFFLARFSSSLKKSQECLFQVFYINQKTFNNTNYPWWHEFSSLLKSI